MSIPNDIFENIVRLKCMRDSGALHTRENIVLPDLKEIFDPIENARIDYFRTNQINEVKTRAAFNCKRVIHSLFTFVCSQSCASRCETVGLMSVEFFIVFLSRA